MITGGAGFIGSHLADRLVLSGSDVTIIDNFASGNISNLSNCTNDKNFHLIKDNLNEPKKLKTSLKNITTIFHLAADPEVRRGYEDPQRTYKQNIETTFHLLEHIRKSDIKNIIFASSSVVYGEPLQIPTPETYGPLFPISQYGGSKLACEALISSYCSNYGINAIIIRLANVIGARSNHGIIWDFIKKLQKNSRKLHYLGDGKQTKSYIHVSDCVDGFLLCAKKSSKKLEVYNLGNDDKVDVLSIARIVCKNMRLENVSLVAKGGTKDGRGWIGDVKQMQLDISNIKKLGWKPRFTSKQAVNLASKELIKEIRN
jgi:UDP-glucose 4-epimerase